jgi:hypothetical protein
MKKQNNLSKTTTMSKEWASIDWGVGRIVSRLRDMVI